MWDVRSCYGRTAGQSRADGVGAPRPTSAPPARRQTHAAFPEDLQAWPRPCARASPSCRSSDPTSTRPVLDPGRRGQSPLRAAFRALCPQVADAPRQLREAAGYHCARTLGSLQKDYSSSGSPTRRRPPAPEPRAGVNTASSGDCRSFFATLSAVPGRNNTDVNQGMKEKANQINRP